MTIANDHVVEIDYTLTDESGKIIDSSKGHEPLTYLHGKRNIIPGLEKKLIGHKAGDEIKVVVVPEEGYGIRNDQLVQAVPKAELASIPNLEVGMQLQAQTPDGAQLFTVVELDDANVTLDGNHPLAGVTLNFEVKVVSVRKATAEELAHGHAHGPGGHHH